MIKVITANEAHEMSVGDTPERIERINDILKDFNKAVTNNAKNGDTDCRLYFHTYYSDKLVDRIMSIIIENGYSVEKVTPHILRISW